MKLLLTHKADLDGITPVILLNLVKEDFEYQLFEVSELNDFISERISGDYFSKYDEIFITDLGIDEDIALKIKNSKYHNKFKLFDHHDSRNYLNKYDFAQVIEEIDGFKECGTTLFYKHLLNIYPNSILNKNSVIMFVELVRENDTWQFIEFKNESDNLNALFSFYGKENFIEHYTEVLQKQNEFYFSELELEILKGLNENKRIYLEEMKDKVIIEKIKNYNIGFVFAEQYRSELGDYLARIYNDQVDFIAIINMNRHISFRGIKDIPINKFAEMYGGGGHPKACAMPLKENIKDMIIKEIFGENR